MKILTLPRTLLLAASLPWTAMSAVVISETHRFTSSPFPLAAADGAGIPVSDTRTIANSGIRSITDVNVRLSLANPSQAGAFNGDFYVSLQHETGFSVLLNRVGRRPGTLASQTRGYGDNGFSITLDDQAANGDIHLYRRQLSGGSDAFLLDPQFRQPLTGLWAPDGRLTSPLQVLSTDARVATLSSFNGLPANGGWTLMIVDFNGGGQAFLNDWDLTISGVAVPEPEVTVLLAAAGLAVFWVVRRRKAAEGLAP